MSAMLASLEPTGIASCSFRQMHNSSVIAAVAPWDKPVKQDMVSMISEAAILLFQAWSVFR